MIKIMENKLAPITPVKLFPAVCVAAVLTCFALPACGGASHLSGTSVAKGAGLGNGFVMDKPEFGFGDTVTLSMMAQRFE
jgi:hypothetical protein